MTTELHPSAQSWQDANGVLLRHDGDAVDDEWVYRGLTDEGEKVLEHIEATLGLEKLVKLGFVPTERTHQPASSNAAGLRTVLRHRRVKRVIYPMEWTLSMWREALAAFCDLSLGLMEHGLCLVDAEPHNFLFDADGRPVFIDFGSLRLRGKNYWMRPGWHREFKDNFLLPILLHNAGLHQLAHAVKGEPFETAFKRTYRWSAVALVTIWPDLLRWTSKLSGNPRLYFRVIKWRLARPDLGRETTEWSDYETQGGEWGSWKQAAVEESLSMPGIGSVLDVAGNKGRHVFEAARRGFTTILTDIDEVSLEAARVEAHKRGLRLFVGQLDICRPTPPWGKGLLMENSFDRLGADLVLALAVSHHLVRNVRLPFRTFAAILDHYSRRYILAEYVDVADVHVKKWVGKRGFPPTGYSEREFTAAFAALGYRVVRTWHDAPRARLLFLFEKP